MGKEEFEDSLYGYRMGEWQQVRPLAQGIVYYDSMTKMAYSHLDYLPESVRGRLQQKHAFESHSQRAYFIVENNKLTEYKGLTWPYSDTIVPASDQPRGLLVREHGEREARALNDIAQRGGNIKAEYHNVGIALLKRVSPSKLKIEVKPLTTEEKKKLGKGSDSEIIHYGVLKRWGDDYIPFIRLDLFQIVHQLARMEGIGYIELLSNALARLGRVLRRAHELGIYHCFTHPGNVDAHGNLIDYEHAIYRDELAAIKEEIKTRSEDVKLLSEECLRFRDIDLFFGGTREVLMRCQERFKLTREDLMTKIRFLREHIELSVGIPVFELLAHLNIGFYEDTLKKLHSKDQEKIIGAFIDTYCPIDKDVIKKEVFFTLTREGEWTEEVSGFIANPENLKGIPARQLPSEFILDLWKQPPLKP